MGCGTGKIEKRKSKIENRKPMWEVRTHIDQSSIFFLSFLHYLYPLVLTTPGTYLKVLGRKKGKKKKERKEEYVNM